MPDQCAALRGVGGALDEALGGAHLVGAEDDLLELVVLAGEEDEVGQGTEHTARGEEGLDQGLEVAGLLIAPVEERLRARLQVAP